jgi:hypothetical protein
MFEQLEINCTYVLQGNDVLKTLRLKYRGYQLENCPCFTIIETGEMLPLSAYNVRKLVKL